MNISANLKEKAIQEFEVNFGELINDFGEDSDVYSFMVNEFIKGVEYGLVNNTHNDEAFNKEANIRYNHKNNLLQKPTEQHIENQVKKCIQLVFLYGASWGHTIVNGVLV